MTKCKRCERATDLFVCKACISELRKRLADLPWWIDRLTETAVGQANLGDGARKGERRDVLHGDDTLVSHVEPFPRDKDTTPTARDRRDRHQGALWHALALGRVNGRASDELDRIHNALSTTIRDMCETRGLDVPEFRTRPRPLPVVVDSDARRPADRFSLDSAPPARAGSCRRCFVTLPTSAAGPLCDDCDGAPEMCTADDSPADELRVTYAGRRGDETHSIATTARMAKWLHRHASNIALQENGAEICDEIEQVYRSITRVVNRPPEPMTLGPCITDPAPDEVLAERGRKGDNSTRCGYALMAPSRSGWIVCPQCEVPRLVDDVLAHNLGELDDRNATVRELVDVVLPRLNEHVPQSTIERWIRRGWVPVRGRDAEGHQMVRIGDVRAVRGERPRNAKRSEANGVKVVVKPRQAGKTGEGPLA
ncbi:helix-turn-helix DNA binding domain protein [Mycobacterium phage prophi104-2]|uniref:hypothetical protein n=1 Tax=Mycobacteroides abscessus TaxID=36809 RepID=UPI0009CC74F8|nr:helix-turn-helix DNA binding domain protein [Mycobacterium phage prophi104-2]SLF11964.1 Bacteriophage protein [Mycobacteroides abscessus subsp. massiliense]